MAFWRNWLSPAAAAKSPAPRVKSAERIRNEQSILENRRRILAKIETLQQQRGARETEAEAIDRDTARAALVVKRMLRDLEGKG